MKRNSIISGSLLILLSLVSCKEDNSEKMLSRLQGDWVSLIYKNDFISFRDTSYFGGDQYEEFEPLSVKNDSLIVSNRGFSFNYSRVTDKYIWKFDPDINKEIPKYISTQIHHDNNIKLISLEVRFINFWHRGLSDWALYFNENLECFLKVEKTNNSFYVKNRLPYSIGLYYTKIMSSDFEFFQKKFQNIPLGKVKKEYRSTNYSVGRSCFPHDESQLLFTCKFGFNDRDEVKSISFDVRGFMYTLPGELGAFLFHLNKIHDFIKFDQTDKLHSFEFYDPDYKDYFHDIEIEWLRTNGLLVEFEMTEDSVLRLIKSPSGFEK